MFKVKTTIFRSMGPVYDNLAYDENLHLHCLKLTHNIVGPPRFVKDPGLHVVRSSLSSLLALIAHPHTYWCGQPVNDSYQQGPFSELVQPVRATSCNQC